MEQHHLHTQRILIDSQINSGIIDAQSTLAVTNHWLQRFPESAFIIVTDHQQFSEVSLPLNVDYIHMPGRAHWLTANHGESDIALATFRMHKKIFKTAVRWFDPHTVIVHLSAGAVTGNEHAIATYTREHHPETQVVLTLWLPDNEPGFSYPYGIDLALHKQLKSLYDEIWYYTPKPILYYSRAGDSPTSAGHLNGATNHYNPL